MHCRSSETEIYVKKRHSVCSLVVLRCSLWPLTHIRIVKSSASKVKRRVQFLLGFRPHYAWISSYCCFCHFSCSLTVKSFKWFVLVMILFHLIFISWVMQKKKKKTLQNVHGNVFFLSFFLKCNCYPTANSRSASIPELLLVQCSLLFLLFAHDFK